MRKQQLFLPSLLLVPAFYFMTQSGSIFSSLKDGIINDHIPITLDLVFKKMQKC